MHFEYICVLSTCELPLFTRLILVALEFVEFFIVKGAFVDAPVVSWLIPTRPPDVMRNFSPTEPTVPVAKTRSVGALLTAVLLAEI